MPPMTAVRKPFREGLYQAVGALVEHTAKIFKLKTGKELDAKLMVFIKEVILYMVALIDEAISSGGKVDVKAIAKQAVSRGLAAAGIVVEEKSMAECTVAVISLAVATVDVFGIMVGAAGLSSTGGGAFIGIPVLIASAAFYAYQVGDVANTCGEAYVASVERDFEVHYNAASKRKMITNYSAMLCEAPPAGVHAIKPDK